MTTYVTLTIIIALLAGLGYLLGKITSMIENTNPLEALTKLFW
jgi:hypothetical protein